MTDEPIYVDEGGRPACVHCGQGVLTTQKGQPLHWPDDRDRGSYSRGFYRRCVDEHGALLDTSATPPAAQDRSPDP